MSYFYNGSPGKFSATVVNDIKTPIFRVTVGMGCRCHHYISIEVHVKSWPTGYNSQKIILIWGFSMGGRCLFLDNTSEKFTFNDQDQGKS